MLSSCLRQASSTGSEKGTFLLALTAVLTAISGCGGGSSPRPSFEVSQPTAVLATERFTEIGAGNWHMCALSRLGKTWCWGSNERGQLGAASDERCMGDNLDCSSKPLQVSGSQPLASIAASDLVSCGLSAAGAAWCWGMDLGGQLGDGAFTSSATPVAVSGGHAFTALASSLYAGLICGVQADHSLWCWGTGFGFGTKGPAASGVPKRWDAASGTVAWRKLAVGQGHACGLDGAGRAWCVGSAAFGSLGDGAGLASATPVAVAGARAYRDIAVGIDHSCAVTVDGVAWCWGLGAGVGNGVATSAIQPTPVAVTTDQRFISITAASRRSCALTAQGKAWCWGEGAGATLGDGAAAQRTAPVAVAGGHRFRSLAMGGVATCGLDTDGALWCWGYNEMGAVGVPIE